MRRRGFIAGAAALLISMPRARAQGAHRRLGYLGISELPPELQNAWLDGLRSHGWVDGRNLIIEYRYARSQNRFPALATELVAISPDLIIASGPQPTEAL